MDDEKEFKVTDRRSSAGAKDEEKSNQGEGFTMKEKEPQGPDQIDFATFVFSLATGALISLGLAPDPITKKKMKDLKLAKQNIELLALLQDKTRGNLSDEESKLLESLLAETRLRFVEASR